MCPQILQIVFKNTFSHDGYFTVGYAWRASPPPFQKSISSPVMIPLKILGIYGITFQTYKQKSCCK